VIKLKLYTADLETTTDENDCRVWAWAVEEIGNFDNWYYGNSLDGFFLFMENSNNSVFYIHNLKFDADFLMVYLFQHGFRHVKDRTELDTKTFTTLISDKGQFYSMKICFWKKGKRHKSVLIIDSYKILPFKVEEIAKAFDLPIRKLKLDYHAYREIGHKLTQEEIDYIKNDVDIVARALAILFGQDLTKQTQGSNALYDYKKTIGQKYFEKWFPVPDYDADIRPSYKGGFTYLNPKYKNVDIGEGIVFDVNSLYPWVMYECMLPYGEGIYFEGKYKKDDLYNLYIQRFKCQFELKEGYLPTIQLKGNLSFVPTEYITSSGDEEVTLTLTNIDLELFFKHYDVYNIEWISGWKFKSSNIMFKPYINKWMEVKIKSTLDGNKAMRTLAKLMLNALYGKFGLNPNVRSKIPFYDNGIIRFTYGEKEIREPIYLPVATFVTAYARHKTITSAQNVYDRFIYADTDSLHLIGTEIPKELEVDPVKLGAWKHESTFKRARFLRQKCYIEDEYKEDGSSELKITCAGMPADCYEYVTWENFKPGASYRGKKSPKHVVGGVVLKEIDFTIKM